jgi:hypothetical protein
MDRARLVRKVAAAEEKLETAERELNTALEKLKAIIAGDNVMVTKVVLKAFERTRETRRDLAELKQLLDANSAES